MTTFNYNDFEITIEKRLRNKFGGFDNTQSPENGLTEVKAFTITYKGESREEEFKSIPECKRFIDKGRLSYWVKSIDKRK